MAARAQLTKPWLFAAPRYVALGLLSALLVVELASRVVPGSAEPSSAWSVDFQLGTARLVMIVAALIAAGLAFRPSRSASTEPPSSSDSPRPDGSPGDALPVSPTAAPDPRSSPEPEIVASREELVSLANRVRTFAASFPGLLFELHKRADGTQRYEFFGGSMLKTLGVDARHACAEPDRVFRALHPDDFLTRERVAAEAMTTGAGYAMELRWLTPERRTIWTRSIAVARIADDGGTIWSGLCIDVTELKAARDLADAANEAKSDFLASVSHEIRTPLNAMLGFTDLLQQSSLSEQQQHYVSVARNAGQSLMTLVNQILDISRIEEKSFETEAVPFSLRAVADRSRSMVSEGARQKLLRLDLHVGANVPDMLVGDPGRVQQILLNLLGNAIKFTDAGDVQLWVSQVGGDDGHARLRFAVVDTGIGIPTDKQTRLFQRFSQVELDAARRSGGTGLGLAISRMLVERMGGTIGVDTVRGRGSTFWFEIPFVVRQGEAPDVEADLDDDDRLQASARILLVEDVAINRELIAALLSGSGLSIESAENGAEAVQAVRSKAYDLILMDVQMPVMDGIEATRAIRSGTATSSRAVPIVALTANAMPGVLAKCRAAGMNDHVTKPVDKAELLRVIRRWLRGAGHHPPDTAAPSEPAFVPVLEKSIIEELSGAIGRREVLGHLRSFASELRGRLSAIEAPGVGHELLEREAHSLVSVAGQLGFAELSRDCRILMDACRQPSSEDLRPHQQRLRATAERTAAELDQLLDTMTMAS